MLLQRIDTDASIVRQPTTEYTCKRFICVIFSLTFVFLSSCSALEEMERNGILRDLGFVLTKCSLFLGDSVHLPKLSPNEGITKWLQYTLGTIAQRHNVYFDVFRESIVRPVEEMLRTQSAPSGTAE